MTGEAGINYLKAPIGGDAATLTSSKNGNPMEPHPAAGERQAFVRFLWPSSDRIIVAP